MFCLSAAVAVVSVAGCNRAAAPAAEAHTLRIAIQNSPEALPVFADLLYADPLLTIDWHGKPSLRIASDYRWQEDGRTLEVRIRPGVQFHDGTPVTPAAVADVLRNQKRTGGFQFVTTVDTAGNDLVRIHLSRPDAFLIIALGGTPIVEPGKPDVGTGPFKLLSRSPVVRAQRNPTYYRGVPGIEQVQVTTYDTPRAGWASMMHGELDMVTEVNRESVEFLVGAKRFETYSSIRPYYIPLVFNLRHPILKNVEVRRALADAIDRDEIVRRAMRNHGQVAEDPVWPYHWAYTPAAQHHSFDPAAAAARLEAAGFPIRPDSPPDAMPSRFRIRCMFWKDPQYERIALMLQRQLATVGVDLLLEPVEQDTLAERIRRGDFETYVYQLGSGRSFNYTYLLWHSDSNGVGQRQNAGYTGANEVLDRLRAAYTDSDIRNSDVRIAVADLRQRFYEDVPAAFIAWLESTRAIDSRFDVGDASDPDIVANLWSWSVAKPQQRVSR
jgi:peptide/nickel transport system substrate-binding protein